MDGGDYRVTVHIGDARPGDIVTIEAERLADPWMQGQIAAGNLVRVGENAAVSAQEPPHDDGTAGDDVSPSESV